MPTFAERASIDIEARRLVRTSLHAAIPDAAVISGGRLKNAEFVEFRDISFLFFAPFSGGGVVVEMVSAFAVNKSEKHLDRDSAPLCFVPDEQLFKSDPEARRLPCGHSQRCPDIVVTTAPGNPLSSRLHLHRKLVSPGSGVPASARSDPATLAFHFAVMGACPVLHFKEFGLEQLREESGMSRRGWVVFPVPRLAFVRVEAEAGGIRQKPAISRQPAQAIDVVTVVLATQKEIDSPATLMRARSGAPSPFVRFLRRAVFNHRPIPDLFLPFRIAKAAGGLEQGRFETVIARRALQRLKCGSRQAVQRDHTFERPLHEDEITRRRDSFIFDAPAARVLNRDRRPGGANAR